jgi:hypothetical protein
MNIEHALQRVREIDFSRQVNLLESREGLARDGAESCVELYRKWLAQFT